MISTIIDTYLENLFEYIFVDDKLVTYKWLSKKLGLHVNLAKQILWQFWKEHDKGKETLATFTLMGYLADGRLRVEIVKEPDLPSAKQKFVKLKAEHLYSLQQVLSDLELLALCDNGDHRKSAIVCKEIISRSGEELRVLRWGSKSNNEAAPTDPAKKSMQFTQSKPISGADSRPESEAKKTGFADVFGRDANRQKGPSKLPTCVTSNETTATPFSNDKDMAYARGRKRQGSKKRERSNKRLRLDAAGSRSSEESSGDEEEEDDNEILCSPEGAAPLKNIVRSKSPNSPPEYKIENGKRKVRKLVDKTSLDDNGYLITEKKYIYESSSDKEEGSTASKTEAPKPKAAPKPKRTQANLLNFFKKS